MSYLTSSSQVGNFAFPLAVVGINKWIWQLDLMKMNDLRLNQDLDLIDLSGSISCFYFLFLSVFLILAFSISLLHRAKLYAHPWTGALVKSEGLTTSGRYLPITALFTCSQELTTFQHKYLHQVILEDSMRDLGVHVGQPTYLNWQLCNIVLLNNRKVFVS